MKTLADLKDFLSKRPLVIDHGKGIAQVCELQDIFGRADLRDLRHFYRDLNEDLRKAFAFTVLAVEGFETAQNIIRTVIFPVEAEPARQKLEEELEREYKKLEETQAKVAERFAAFEEYKGCFFKRLAKARKEVEQYKQKLHRQALYTEYVKAELRKVRGKSKEAEKALAKLEPIRQALASIKEALE